MKGVHKDRATITFQPPADDGGSEITGYVIEKRDARRTTWSDAGTCSADTLEHTITKLYEGQDYFFRVAAKNKMGTGAFAETPEAVTAKLPFGECGYSLVDHKWKYYKIQNVEFYFDIITKFLFSNIEWYSW